METSGERFVIVVVTSEDVETAGVEESGDEVTAIV